MQDLLRDSWARPSRWAGYGVVAVVHLLMWEALSIRPHAIPGIPNLPLMQAVLLDKAQPPAAAPPRSLSTSPVVWAGIYVPMPEIVVRESPSPAAVLAIAPAAMLSDQHATVPATEFHAVEMPVIPDSEVDYVVRPAIRYPLAAKRARQQGTVLLSVVVDEQGMVRRITIYRSSGYHRLDEVALRAARALRVKPYVRNGRAMQVEIRVPVEFSLSGAV